jgi:hypothetical protein
MEDDRGYSKVPVGNFATRFLSKYGYTDEDLAKTLEGRSRSTSTTKQGQSNKE